MQLLFAFTDAPMLGDVWETNLDIDVLIHTRPSLIAERDRFATHYSSYYAQSELQSSVIYGLKAYGYHLLPSLYYTVSDFFMNFEPEMHNAHVTANRTNKEYSATPQQIAEATADYASLERYLLQQTLDSPELIQQFIRGPLTQMANLQPTERITEIYRLRAAQFARNIPFAKNAVAIIDRLFSESEPGHSFIQIHADLSIQVHKELIADIVAGLIERLEQNTTFLDLVITQWVLPILHERFPKVDAFIDEIFTHIHARNPEHFPDRKQYIDSNKADADWLALAKKLGAPLPNT